MSEKTLPPDGHDETEFVGGEGLSEAGMTRPSAPRPVFAEDFSILVRAPRRLRITRMRINVLS